MTLSTTQNRASYSGNGVTTAFSFPYYFLDNTHLVVLLVDDVTGVSTTQVLNTNYTLTGAGVAAGGTVTMTTAPASGKTLVIYRDPTTTQELDLVENDPLPAESVEEQLDKSFMLAQRIKELVTRSVRLSDGFTDPFDTALPALIEADRAVVINSTGNGLALGPTTEDIEAAADAAANIDSAVAIVADTVPWKDVLYKTFADTPISVTTSDKGKVLSINTSGGNVVVNLPEINTLSLATPHVFTIKKTSNDANTVTINRAGTDTFDDASTSKVISLVGQSIILIPDTDGSPDKWTTITSVGSTIGTTGTYAAIIGTALQVAQGLATHSSFSSAQSALSDGDNILWLRGSYTESLTISKKLFIEGQGYGTSLTGSVTFASGSSDAVLKQIRITGNVTINSGVVRVELREFYIGSANTITDNNSTIENLIEGKRL